LFTWLFINVIVYMNMCLCFNCSFLPSFVPFGVIIGIFHNKKGLLLKSYCGITGIHQKMVIRIFAQFGLLKAAHMLCIVINIPGNHTITEGWTGAPILVQHKSHHFNYYITLPFSPAVLSQIMELFIYPKQTKAKANFNPFSLFAVEYWFIVLIGILGAVCSIVCHGTDDQFTLTFHSIHNIKWLMVCFNT
jgi:hypothetical protein